MFKTPAAFPIRQCQLLAAVLVAGVTACTGTATAQDGARHLAAQLFGLPVEAVSLAEEQGEPPARAVTSDGKLVGYLASTWAVAGSVGYSGKPIDVAIAIDREARIAGARLIEQSEPLLTIGVTEADVARYVDGFVGLPLGASVEARALHAPPVIAGASVSSAVIRDAVIRSGRAVALSRGLLGEAGAARIKRSGYRPADWTALETEGAIQSRTLSVAEVGEALGGSPLPPGAAEPDSLFIALHTALLTPPEIGQNLLGQQEFTELTAAMSADDHAILVAGRGIYSFKGTAWQRAGRFERIELHQGAQTIQLSAESHRNVTALAVDDAPALREMGVFVVPGESGFDPSRPWRLSLIVERTVEAGTVRSAAFDLVYDLPERFITRPEASAEGARSQPVLWQENWRAAIPTIAVVVLLLGVLATILVFQDALARRYRLYRIVRTGFLAVTLVVLGWWIGAQLSVVHVLSFAQALRTGFQWETFLLDPAVFILWSFVAVALLFWGRGVFCGWLCPFGAMQELLNHAARRLGVRQIEVPFALHERLWPIKYIIFLGLFGLSLHSIGLAFTLAEVEPFKTAITLKFMRAWPFVAFVLALLAAGLFIERFYCRYLCPLGAALAIPARLRMFNWLKRRPQCGRECRICASRCTVQAIHPDGSINPNECIHCLHCQTLYYDPTTCPPLIARAKRRAQRRKGASAS